MNRFTVTDLPLAGLKLVERKHLRDTRGYMVRLFCAEELAIANWLKPIAQINHTYTGKRGTVRGMHFQHPPHTEMKLVSCIHGEVYDVAVDLRADSSTFLRWHAEHLSADNGRALLIPEGFAHGFQTLTDEAELLYCHSTSYSTAAEDGLNPLDVRLDIAWPVAVTELSPKDANRPPIAIKYQGVRL
jgi:dTDP-4-dehydrorhamnose 3,5-epimerase